MAVEKSKRDTLLVSETRKCGSSGKRKGARESGGDESAITEIVSEWFRAGSWEMGALATFFQSRKLPPTAYATGRSRLPAETGCYRLELVFCAVAATVSIALIDGVSAKWFVTRATFDKLQDWVFNLQVYSSLLRCASSARWSLTHGNQLFFLSFRDAVLQTAYRQIFKRNNDIT